VEIGDRKRASRRRSRDASTVDRYETSVSDRQVIMHHPRRVIPLHDGRTRAFAAMGGHKASLRS
jgi:hypothetical protein